MLENINLKDFPQVSGAYLFINENDEIIPFYENYENYLIRKIIKSTEFVAGYKGKSKVIIKGLFNA